MSNFPIKISNCTWQYQKYASPETYLATRPIIKLNSRYSIPHSYNWNSEETGTSNNPKVPSLENMVDVVAHPMEAAIAFGELLNWYGVSHYPGGLLHLFYWTILVSFLWVHHLIIGCQKSLSVFLLNFQLLIKLVIIMRFKSNMRRFLQWRVSNEMPTS